MRGEVLAPEKRRTERRLGIADFSRSAYELAERAARRGDGPPGQ